MTQFELKDLNKQSEGIRKAVAKTIWSLPYGFTPTIVVVSLQFKTVVYQGVGLGVNSLRLIDIEFE